MAFSPPVDKIRFHIRIIYTLNLYVSIRIASSQDDFVRVVTAIRRQALRINPFDLATGATDILGEFYGLTHQEVALRRMVIGLPKRKGRHRALSDEESSELWRRCSTTVRQEHIDPQDKPAMLRMAADMAEQMTLPLAVIWNALRDWIKAKQF
jgi:hypothetical protein